MTAPERSRAQRLDALERANTIRVYRKHLKRDLKAGRRSIESLLRDPPDEILTAKIYDLLLATPKYGRVKVDKILTQCRISPTKALDGLTQRQRDELLSHVRRIEAMRGLLPRERQRQYQREYQRNYRNLSRRRIAA